jgi:two-component system sensor histidine kinase SenX3
MAASLLENEVPAAAGKVVLRKLSGAIDSMQNVVEDLILFARTATDHFPLNKTETNIQVLLGKIIEAHRPLWEGRRLSVKLSSEGECRPLLADGGLLETAFTRLLLNAIHFNKQGGRIDVSAVYAPAAITVAFSDTGVGVAVNERERIFDGLYQVAEHMTRQVGGLGVGLAITRRIVEAHGGEVSVSDHPGEGSVFTVRLPDIKIASNATVARS